MIDVISRGTRYISHRLSQLRLHSAPRRSDRQSFHKRILWRLYGTVRLSNNAPFFSCRVPDCPLLILPYGLDCKVFFPRYIGHLVTLSCTNVVRIADKIQAICTPIVALQPPLTRSKVRRRRGGYIKPRTERETYE